MTPRLVFEWTFYAAATLLVARVAWDLLRDPWYALDLVDDQGQHDHGKVVGLGVFAALYALAWGYLGIQHDLHWVIWSLLAVLPYGLLGLRVFFSARRGEMAPPAGALVPSAPEPNLYHDNERN